MPRSNWRNLYSSRSLSDLPMNPVSYSGNMIWMLGICLNRLLNSAPRCKNQVFSFDSAPPRGGLRSLSGGAVGIVAETTYEFRTLSQGPTNS